tara:strand:+ start:625 stop:1662 length:1038 start_codon:yes stop_codon:yes gene_type:complete
MAEQPAMDSATETQTESVAPMPKPLNTQGEAAEALKNLLNVNASETQETASEESTKEVSDSETNIDDALEDPELIDQIEDETPLDSNQELYKLTINGQETEVTLDELKKGYSRQSDYTRKTEKLSQDRKSVEEKNSEYTRLNEEAKIKRDQYEKQLQVLSEQLRATEPQVDMERLYQEDPAEFVKQKAEQDRRKELQTAAQQEQDRIRQEKQQESEKVYSQYLDNERKLLAEKLPIYGDKDKGPEFVKNLTNYAKSIGYADQEIAMLVDHRAVMMLANAYRYDKLKKANLNNKKVTKVSKVVSSSSPKVQDDSDVAKRMKSKKATLKRTGKVNDAVSVLQELYSQ